MEILHAIILSVVEGITEFLPVSSTGHMIITSHLMHIPQTEFLKTFEIAIQLGAIMAVFSRYWRVFLLDWEVVTKLTAAFVPTALVGLVLYKMIKKVLMGNAWVVVWALLVGGVLIILFEHFYKEKRATVNDLKHITYTQAMLIGLCQALAVVPGVSRSAATILGGLMLGVGRATIVEFSFLLAVPTMLAATVLDIYKSTAVLKSSDWGILGIGFMVAWLVAWITVRFFIKYVQQHNFTAFGVYRIAIALVLMVLFKKFSL